MGGKIEKKFEKLKRGEVTTISVPKSLKKHIDDIKGKNTYTEFLADLVREDIINKLEELRAPKETYGDVILELASGVTRSEDELEILLKSAKSQVEIKESGKTAKVPSPWQGK